MTSFGQFSKLGDMVQNGGNYKTEAKVMVNASPRAVQEHRGRKDAKMEVKTKADSDAPWVKSSSATVARGARNLSNRAAMPGIVDGWSGDFMKSSAQIHGHTAESAPYSDLVDLVDLVANEHP
jgi:hypothetical protein